jgi:DNA-binding HxlR family transcriptional regulator
MSQVRTNLVASTQKGTNARKAGLRAPPDECGPDDVAEPAVIIERVLDMVDGKWKVLVVMHLTVQRVCRFGELRRKLPHVSQRMLTLQLREMEADGLLTRHVFAEVPPRVEYSLTEPGRDLKSIYMAMHKWGLRHPDAKHARAALAKVKTTQPEDASARAEVRSKGRVAR